MLPASQRAGNVVRVSVVAVADLTCATRWGIPGAGRAVLRSEDQSHMIEWKAMNMRSDAVVLFGVTGDLVSKKLFPALYELTRRDRLDVPVIGVARSPGMISSWSPRPVSRSMRPMTRSTTRPSTGWPATFR
ncbi:hypothetical protein NKG94_09270 [Micromonospora sp. M12]